MTARIERARLGEQELVAEIAETSVRIRGAGQLARVNRKSLELAESVVERLQRLAQSEQAILRSTKTKLQRRLETAQAEIKLAELDLAHSVLHAPYAGIVATQAVEAGRCFSAMQEVIGIVDPNSAEVALDVPLFVFR